MIKKFFLICSLCILNYSFGQGTKKSFPDSYLGVYKGELRYETKNGMAKIPMEFKLLKTDSTNIYDYWLVYNNQPRTYSLIVKDLNKGVFDIDENNGIILPARFTEDTLFSWFEVGTNKVSSRLKFEGDLIEFEILFSNTKSKTTTGGVSDQIPKVFGYPISAIQRATLKKQN